MSTLQDEFMDMEENVYSIPFKSAIHSSTIHQDKFVDCDENLPRSDESLENKLNNKDGK